MFHTENVGNTARVGNKFPCFDLHFYYIKHKIPPFVVFLYCIHYNNSSKCQHNFTIYIR